MYFIAYAMQLLTLICALGGSALALLQLWQQRGDALALIEKVHWAITGALSLAAALLLHALFWNDFSLVYVASYTDRVLPAFYRLTAFWAGQPGSMLFWAFSVAISGSIFALTPAYKRLTPATRLWYWGFFYAIMAFFALILSCWSNPFEMQSPVPPDGNGLNPLLQNPGMIFHPPLLFLGYGGFTVPACRALAQSLSGGEGEDGWHRVTRPVTLLAWAFLTAGIILGMWWAYMELGWGGYWAWDPVENASLIPWLISTAALHTLIVQERRNKLHRVNVALMCLTTISAFFATYLVRSGVVQSVHAFEGDPVSLVLFGALIVVALLAGVVGLVVRWKSFGPAADGSDEVENLLSKEGAYYFNNVIMVVFATLLAYLTVSSALPGFLPFGGQTVSSGTFNAIARPLGVVYLAILAVCPLLAWGKTLRSKFLKQARIPAICALVLFAVLAVYWATYLVPSYNGIIAAGGTAAEELASDGPAWYYNGLALVGFFVASMLLFNSLFMLGRIVRSYKESHSCGAVAAFGGCLRNRPASFGGFLSHAAMAVILVGLIGSSMYVTEKVAYIGYDEATDTASETFQIKDYTLEYVSNSVTEVNNGDVIMYTVNYDAYKDGAFIGQVSPSVQLAQKTQQQKLVASVISLPTEDLFVVYRGVNNDGAFSMDVRVNPLISLVWVGFGLLMVGVCVATAGRRRASRKLTDAQRAAVDEASGESATGAA